MVRIDQVVYNYPWHAYLLEHGSDTDRHAPGESSSFIVATGGNVWYNSTGVRLKGEENPTGRHSENLTVLVMRKGG